MRMQAALFATLAAAVLAKQPNVLFILTGAAMNPEQLPRSILQLLVCMCMERRAVVASE